MPRSLSPPLSALSDVIITKTGSHLREQRAKYEKSTLWKRLGEGVNVGDSLSNLIIAIHRIIFWCTRFSSSFRNGLRQYHELMHRIQCWIYALIIIARIVRNENCLLGLWLRRGRWWKQVYSEVAGGACCKCAEGINKVHSLLNNSKLSMTNYKSRSVSSIMQYFIYFISCTMVKISVWY